MNPNSFLTVPLARPLRLLALFTVATASLGGCGGASAPTATPPPPPPPPSPPLVLDFAAIEGVWIGEVLESGPGELLITYEATLEFTEGAVKDRKVGTVDYSILNCGGDLLALVADGADYAVTEDLTYGTNLCRNGEIRLQLDTDEAELDYKWYTIQGELHATGTLTQLD